MNQKKYAMRMEKNVDDKLIILNFLDNEEEDKFNILDFGCGSGSILRHLRTSFPNSKVVGFDKSEFMIKRAKEKHPEGIFFSEFQELETFIKNSGGFEYIILNSLLHEVYSYGDGFVSVVELLKDLSKYLTNTGKILVRDGILDTDSVENINQIEKYQLCNPQEANFFLKEYTYLSPFPNHLQIVNGNIVGIWYEVREFLNKYTWGFDSLYREAKEIVNFSTLDMYHELFAKAAFRISSNSLVQQEEYFTYLDKIVEIGDVRWNTKIVFSATRNL